MLQQVFTWVTHRVFFMMQHNCLTFKQIICLITYPAYLFNIMSILCMMLEFHLRVQSIEEKIKVGRTALADNFFCLFSVSFVTHFFSHCSSKDQVRSYLDRSRQNDNNHQLLPNLFALVQHKDREAFL